VCVCVCSCCTPCYIGVYQCGLWSIVQACLCRDWRFCAHLVVGGMLVAEVRSGGLRCWGLCVFVIKCLPRLWVFSVVVRLDSYLVASSWHFTLFHLSGSGSGAYEPLGSLNCGEFIDLLGIY